MSRIASGYARAKAKSAPVKYGLFTFAFARDGSRACIESAREALTPHAYVRATVEADHPLKVSGGHSQFIKVRGTPLFINERGVRLDAPGTFSE